jgi:hypothetical protein
MAAFWGNVRWRATRLDIEQLLKYDSTTVQLTVAL